MATPPRRWPAARQLTEFVDASACLISLVDPDRGTVHDRAGYARPPFRIDRIAGDYALADYPRTAEVIATGNAMTCTADDAEAGEMRLLVDQGYRALLMVRMDVDGPPFALIELYDEHRRAVRRRRDAAVRGAGRWRPAR